MNELREKIARCLAFQALQDDELGTEDVVWKWVIKHGCENEWYDKANQILTRIKEAGYVKLADNQEIDIPDTVFFSAEAKACGFTKRSFLEAGWRKVEIENGNNSC